MTTNFTDRINGVIAALAIKAPVKAATTANITLSGEQTIDGVALVSDDRVLVKNQTTASENGIYIVDTSAWSRASDFNGNRDVTTGTLVFVVGGSTYANSVFSVSTANPITIGTSSLTFVNAVFASASGISFIHTGSDAVSTDVQTQLRRASIDAANYGFATGCTGAENLAALTKAVAAASGRIIDLPEGDFYLAPGLGLDTILRGKGRARTRIYKSASGDHVNFYTNAGLRDLSFYGAGGTYTGRGLVIAAGEGQQTCDNVNIGDYDGYCIDFTDTTAGSQSFWSKMKIYRHGGVSADYAVRVEDAAELAAYPRHFSMIESEGTKFVTLGGCNGFYVTNSYIGEVEYSTNTVDAVFVGGRYGSNSTAVTMRGFNNVITGCDVAPVITLASGTGECVVASNSYNNTVPIVDNSGNGGRNIIDTHAVGYTPTFTSGGTAPSIGNGTLSALYSRHGSAITVTINMLIGSTTNLGTGELRFSLPFTPASTGSPAASGITQHVGQCVCYDSSGNTRTYGHIAVTPGVAYATCATASDVVFVNGPFTWATGDWLRATVTYIS